MSFFSKILIDFLTNSNTENDVGDETEEGEGAGIVGDTTDSGVSRPNFAGGPVRVVSGAEQNARNLPQTADEENSATVRTDESQGDEQDQNRYNIYNDTPGDPNTEGRRGKLPNPLNNFAGYSVIQTLSVLKKSELADPDNTYRQNGPSLPILKSGGVGDESVKTSYEKDLGITTEYFIEDLEVDAVMTPNPSVKQTNATLFRFKVIEPYSMGIFFETIANAVRQADEGRVSYIDAPFLLTLDFVGYDDQGREVQMQNLRRHFPLKLDNIEFNVDAGGSTYEVSAYAWNEQAFADEVQLVNQDVRLVGSTLLDLFQTGPENLAKILNERQLALKENGEKNSADAYVIMFPGDGDSQSDPFKNAIQDPQGATSVPPQDGATVKAVEENGVGLDDIQNWAQDSRNVNEIGSSKINTSTFSAGNDQFDRPEVEQNDNGVFVRSGITFDPADSVINIRKGRRIQDIVEDLVIVSEYGQQLVNAAPDSRGRKKWFRIESETYDITDSENEVQRGRSAKIYVYRIVPYLIHQAHFVSATQKPPGISVLKTEVPKEYNYIYTGKNDDIVDFQINFNSAFYQQIQFDLASLGQDSVTNGQTTGGGNEEQSYTGSDSEETGDIDSEPRAPDREQGQPSNANGSTFSGGTETPSTQISRAYNQAIVNGVDLIQAEMEIIGDPYYITDSGIGNYRARRERNQTTKDESMDYQYAEPYLILNFRTPIDINKESGRMSFPTAAGEPVRKFSGLYRITELTNVISGNKFTQRLQMIRLRNQLGEEETETASAIQQDYTKLFFDPFFEVPGGTVTIGEPTITNNESDNNGS